MKFDNMVKLLKKQLFIGIILVIISVCCYFGAFKIKESVNSKVPENWNNLIANNNITLVDSDIIDLLDNPTNNSGFNQPDINTINTPNGYYIAWNVNKTSRKIEYVFVKNENTLWCFHRGIVLFGGSLIGNTTTILIRFLCYFFTVFSQLRESFVILKGIFSKKRSS